MTSLPGRAVLIAVLSVLAIGAGAAPVTDDAVTEVARNLRCVVCQNLSVADSPSEMAKQMRDLIRERLQQGETPDQVAAFFVEKYGQWVLLAPPARGFNVLLWVLPFAGLAAGLGLVLATARRWARRPPAPAATSPATPVTPAVRARIQSELERLAE